MINFNIFLDWLRQNKKKIIFGVVLVVLFVGIFFGGFFLGKYKTVCQVCQPSEIDFSLFWQAYNLLKDNFVDKSKIDSQKILYGAISGMAQSLGDPYTDFFNPENAKKFQQDLAGSFEGIGAEIGIKKDQLTIVAPLKNTPAEKAGLKAGDYILQIDGKNTANMTTEEAVSLIRGKRGTNVTLTIFREGWPTSKDISIIRGTIVIPTMDWEIKNEDVAYIHIYQFGDTLSADFKKTASEILQSNAKKIVLDLRDNPGGYLATSQEIAGYFLEKGQVVTIETFGNGQEPTIYKTEGNPTLLKYPLVVLINQGSASASEILAGALRDNREVKLIGAKSFGKGSVQELAPLQGNSFLKITIAKWLTPNSQSISEVGLEPDIKVENTETDITAGKDAQLDKALEIIGTIK